MRPGPLDAVVAVTHRCDCRCGMCACWRREGEDRLQPAHLAALPPSLRTVNLSGGEPFTRSDLAQFVTVLRTRCPRARISISTSASRPDEVVGQMEQIASIAPRVRLAVSLDGIGHAHDRIRGRAGLFDAVLEVFDALGAAPPSARQRVRLSMTLTRDNTDQVAPVARLAAERGLELGLVAAHALPVHLGEGPPPPSDMVGNPEHTPAAADPAAVRGPLERVLTGWLRSGGARRWLRAHFAVNTYRRLAGLPLRLPPCRAGRDFFFLQADGTVYSCSAHGVRLGDLTRQRWEDIWTGPEAARARDTARRCTANCWMICTARAWYRRHVPGVAVWIARARLAAHCRHFHLPAPAGVDPAQGHPAAFFRRGEGTRTVKEAAGPPAPQPACPRDARRQAPNSSRRAGGAAPDTDGPGSDTTEASRANPAR